MEIEGMPRLTGIWFWSGDDAWLVRDVNCTKNGVPYKIVYMILSEATVARYGIKDTQLNFEMSEHGVYKKEYPASHFLRLSTNPESPIVLMTCNFDGTESFGYEIDDINNKLVRYEKLIATLKDENERQAEQLKVAMQKLRVLSGEKV